MSFLDLYQGDQEQAARIQPNEGHYLPSGFDENFHAAWSDGRLFSQSIAQLNARGAALDDYADEVKSKTGFDLKNDLAPKEGGAPIDYDAVNFKIAALNQNNPNLNIAPLTDDEIDKRALVKAQAAHRNYQAMQAGERTAGGAFGSFVGNAASSAADPINIAGLAIAPETAGIGILSAALRWGAVAGVSQAAIEFASDDFKNQVQPGYMESGEPIKEIGGAFVGGAALGGITKVLGSAWTKVKTGSWPTSVRDAGNVIESEAHTASTNPLPGAEGEIAHREALAKSIDDILAGRPIDVGQQITPDLQQAAVEAERAKIVPEQPSGLPAKQLDLPLGAPSLDPLEMARNGELNSERASQISDELKQSSKAEEDRILGSDADRWRKAIKRSEMYSNRAQDAKAAEQDAIIAEIEGKHSLEDQGKLYGQGMPNHSDPEGWRDLARDLQDVEGSREDAVRTVGFKLRDLPDASSPLSPLDRERLAVIQHAMAKEADRGGNQMQFLKDAFRESSQRYGGGHDAEELILDDAERLKKLMENPPEPLSALPPPQRSTKVPPGPQPVLHTPEQINETLTAPDHQDVIRGDIDRAIDANAAEGNADIKVPGIDEMGNHTMVSVHSAVDEVDAYKKLATDIQACAVQQEAAE